MKTKATAKLNILAAFFIVSHLVACMPSSNSLSSTQIPGTDSSNNTSSEPTTEPATDPSTPPTPAPGDEGAFEENAKGLKITAFADMNIDTSGTYTNSTISIVKSMVSRNPAAILGVGDYIDGEKSSLSDSTYIRMWNSFSKKVLSIMDNARLPFLPSPGNHDAYYTQERNIYDDFWSDRKPKVEYVDDAHYPFYYSFIQDGVFFVSLDDAKYGKLSNRTAQLTWLKEQLTSNRAQNARARVVYGHIPIYSIVSSKANSSTVYENGILAGERRTLGSFTLESILLNNKVDLVIFGHSHGFYSGHYTYKDGKKLQVVSMPCAGSSPRYLVGTSIRTPQGYTEIVFSETNKITIRYFNNAGVQQSLSSLPASLTLDAKNGVKYERQK